MGIKTSQALHICPACGGNLVQPIGFEPFSLESCYLELLCPNCWWSDRRVHDRAEVDRIDEELEHGEAALLADLEEMTRANMQEELDHFVRALAADAILPMDF